MLLKRMSLLLRPPSEPTETSRCLIRIAGSTGVSPLIRNPTDPSPQRAGPMKRIVFVLIALLLNLAAVSLGAQNPAGPPQAQQPPAAAGEVRGVIVAADSSAAAVPRPAVGVRNKSDGKLVAGGYGGEDGSFRIQGLRPGTY